MFHVLLPAHYQRLLSRSEPKPLPPSRFPPCCQDRPFACPSSSLARRSLRWFCCILTLRQAAFSVRLVKSCRRDFCPASQPAASCSAAEARAGGRALSWGCFRCPLALGLSSEVVGKGFCWRAVILRQVRAQGAGAKRQVGERQLSFLLHLLPVCSRDKRAWWIQTNSGNAFNRCSLLHATHEQAGKENPCSH